MLQGAAALFESSVHATNTVRWNHRVDTAFPNPSQWADPDFDCTAFGSQELICWRTVAGFPSVPRDTIPCNEHWWLKQFFCAWVCGVPSLNYKMAAICKQAPHEGWLSRSVWGLLDCADPKCFEWHVITPLPVQTERTASKTCARLVWLLLECIAPSWSIREMSRSAPSWPGIWFSI